MLSMYRVITSASCTDNFEHYEQPHHAIITRRRVLEKMFTRNELSVQYIFGHWDSGIKETPANQTN
ncbi:hypothetical protein CFIMG_001836RA [Ceratocystis fimbriata CBS 114723]|uniref:Uncharacterized protein n=1 Tax=Ceratocystis fimbriata CBS 114723 TaxID=1035309 RepID=A0A2C5X4Z8_9PEZI|nr:hypothetical protein CFIMG_001836RA [Ceratocystis fimbriata CBS 114723]